MNTDAGPSHWEPVRRITGDAAHHALEQKPFQDRVGELSGREQQEPPRAGMGERAALPRSRKEQNQDLKDALPNSEQCHLPGRALEKPVNTERGTGKDVLSKAVTAKTSSRTEEPLRTGGKSTISAHSSTAGRQRRHRRGRGTR